MRRQIVKARKEVCALLSVWVRNEKLKTRNKLMNNKNKLFNKNGEIFINLGSSGVIHN